MKFHESALYRWLEENERTATPIETVETLDQGLNEATFLAKQVDLTPGHERVLAEHPMTAEEREEALYGLLEGAEARVRHDNREVIESAEKLVEHAEVELKSAQYDVEMALRTAHAVEVCEDTRSSEAHVRLAIAQANLESMRHYQAQVRQASERLEQDIQNATDDYRANLEHCSDEAIAAAIVRGEAFTEADAHRVAARDYDLEADLEGRGFTNLAEAIRATDGKTYRMHFHQAIDRAIFLANGPELHAMEHLLAHVRSTDAYQNPSSEAIAEQLLTLDADTVESLTPAEQLEHYRIRLEEEALNGLPHPIQTGARMRAMARKASIQNMVIPYGEFAELAASDDWVPFLDFVSNNPDLVAMRPNAHEAWEAYQQQKAFGQALRDSGIMDSCRAYETGAEAIMSILGEETGAKAIMSILGEISREEVDEVFGDWD